MSRRGGLCLLISEIVLLTLLVDLGDSTRRSFGSSVNWHLAAVEFGFFLVAVLVLVPLTYWAERRSGLTVWPTVALLLAVLATWPLQVVFLPSDVELGEGLLFKLRMILILLMPVGWALLVDLEAKKRGEHEAR